MVYMDTYWFRKEFSGVFIPWKTYRFAITGIRGPDIETIETFKLIENTNTLKLEDFSITTVHITLA